MKKFSMLIVVVFGFLSSICWLMAAYKSRKYQEIINSDGFIEASINDGDADILETMKIQSYWNKWAAFFAAIASLSQVMSEFL